MRMPLSTETRVKESGIILNYLVLLVGLYAWDLKAAYVVLSFICEYVVIIVLVTALTLANGKSLIIRCISAVEVLVGGLVIAAMQGGFIFLILKTYPQTAGWHEMERNLVWTIPAMALPMLLFHLLPLRRIKDKATRLEKKRTDLVTIAVGFLAMVFIGLLVMECFDPDTITPVMAAMIVSRLLLEIYMNHYQKEKPKNEGSGIRLFPLKKSRLRRR
jgi:hypothetical protein